MTASKIVVPYKTATGMAQKEFTVYRTHHGPIVREADGKWVSVRLMQEPLKALTQSYSRTKAKNYKAFREVDGAAHQLVEQHDLRRRRRQHRLLPLELHPEARPEVRLDASRSTAAIRRPTGTACMSIDETPGVLNPPSGWLYNTNNWPWSAAGPEQPEADGLSRLRRRNGARTRAASTRSACSTDKKDFTLDSLIAAAYDSYLPEFDDADSRAASRPTIRRRRRTR